MGGKLIIGGSIQSCLTFLDTIYYWMSEAGLLIFSSSFTLNNIEKQLSTGSLFMDQDLPIFNLFKPSNEKET